MVSCDVKIDSLKAISNKPQLKPKSFIGLLADSYCTGSTALQGEEEESRRGEGDQAREGRDTAQGTPR